MAEVILVEYQVKGLDGLTTELTQASTATEQLNQDLDKTAKATTSAKAQLRQMNNELATMIANGDTSSQKFKELTQRAGQLSDAIQDASGYIKTAGSDTSGLDKALRATNVLVGGFAAVQGATALFGKESENLQKTLLKVNAAMSILAGLQTIQEELSKKDSILTAAATKAKLLYTAATAGASNAVRLLRLAILGLVGGAVIAGIVLLVKNWGKITDALGFTTKAVRELEKAQAALQVQNEEIDKTLEARIKLLKLQGATQEELNAAEKESLLLKRNANAAEIARLQREANDLEERIGGFSASSALNPILALRQRRRIDDLAKLRTEIDKLQDVSVDYEIALKAQTQTQKELNVATEEYAGIIGRVSADSTRIAQTRSRSATEVELAKQAIEVVKTLDDQATDEYIDNVLKRKQAQLDANNEVAKSDKTLRDARVEDANFYLGIISEVNSQINSILQQSQDAQLAQLEAQRAQGLITEKQYIQKVQALKKKQAEQDKKLSIFNILLNTAQAVSKALASAPPPFNFVLAAIVGALGAAELAIAKRTPIPAFRKGVIDLQGPGTATSDSITARLSKGESVMTAEETKNHRDVLLSIRKKQFDRMYMPVNEVLKKNKPMSIPAAQLKGHIDINGGMAVKLDKIYEELVYNNLYTREGNRHTFKIRQAVTKPRASNGIRV